MPLPAQFRVFNAAASTSGLADAGGSPGTTIKLTVTVAGAAVDREQVKAAVVAALGGVVDPSRVIVREAEGTTVVVEIMPDAGEPP